MKIVPSGNNTENLIAAAYHDKYSVKRDRTLRQNQIVGSTRIDLKWKQSV